MLKNMFEILDVNREFINSSLKIALSISKGETHELMGRTDMKKCYFVGQSLFLDTKDEFGFEEIIVLNHEKETYGFFNGGLRMLLSIDDMRTLEEIMLNCKINFEPKFIN